MKRFTTRVRSSALFRRIGMMTLLAGVLAVFVSCDYWPISTWINETDVLVVATNNDSIVGKVLRPQERYSFPGGFYLKGDTEGPASYVIRAYEFVPGKGRIPWYEKSGKPPVYGGQGDLIFYKTYPREEIEAMNYTVTITRNVYPGQSPPASLP